MKRRMGVLMFRGLKFMNELQIQFTWWSLTKERHLLPSCDLRSLPALMSRLSWLSAALARPAFAHFDDE